MDSLTPVALTQSMSLFLGLMPGPDALLNADRQNVVNVQNVRVRETAAVAMSLGSGVLLAALSHDPQPFYIACVVSLSLVAASEFLIRCNPIEGKATTNV